MKIHALPFLICTALGCGAPWVKGGSTVPAPSSPLTIVSAVNYGSGSVASESIAAAFGTGLAAVSVAAQAMPLPAILAGTRVLVEDSSNTVRTAVLFYVSPGQVNFQIPPGTAQGLATVTVQSGAGATSTGNVYITTVAPGVFSADGSGSGVAAASVVVMKADGSRTETLAYQCGAGGCAATPIQLGGPADQAILELFGTGMRGRTSLANVVCTVGDIIATVQYAGPQADAPGLDQVNVILPSNLGAQGTFDVSLAVDSQTANRITIAVTPAGAGDTTSRASQIVSQMSLSEKIGSLHGFSTANQYRTVLGVGRLGIPLLNITNGPAGAANGGPGHGGPATALPAPISLAATWDIHLAKLYGSILGLEAKFLANGLVEGPDINIARVPQNGRSFEAFGEDPYLTGQIAAYHVQGVQSQGVIAESKHFAGNNQEQDRGTSNDIIDERTLREIYLPAFETTVKQSHVGAIMCAYNKVNGPYSCENSLLLKQILKTEWGFDGFITSDFGAVHSTVPSASAGLDLEMPYGAYFDSPVQSAVQSGAMATPMIDDKLVRRFGTMMRLGVFDNQPSNQPLPIQQDGAVARQLAEAGIVLLKNSGSLLPLSPYDLRSIAVVGPYAVAAKSGGGGSAQVIPVYTVDPVPGIQARLGVGVSVRFADGSDLSQAVALAQSSDVVVVMVGDDEAEGSDHSISLSGGQDLLVQSVAAANPRTVVVIKSGSPVLMPWAGNVPAILEAWYPGEEDGNAVAAVLFGEVNPSGKLPFTFPRNLADLPANTPAQYPGVNGTVNYSEGVFVGYRYFDANNIQPLFPFGHGLSYTSFSYKNLAIAASGLTVSGGSSGTITVDFDVTNTGGLAGAEVAQVYVGMPATAVAQPPQQLKGFQKVLLGPGQTGHLRILLDNRSFSYWDVNSHSWQIAPGTYQILVGSSSRDIRLRGQINVN